MIQIIDTMVGIDRMAVPEISLTKHIKPVSLRLELSVYWGDTLIAEVYKAPHKIYYVRNYVHIPVIRLFPKNRLTEYEFMKALRTRCWEPERSDMCTILNLLGLKNYDPLAIVKKTHGISYNDRLWLKFPKDKISYEDVRRIKSGNI